MCAERCCACPGRRRFFTATACNGGECATEAVACQTALSRFGSELLKAGFKGQYNHIGAHKEGAGGLWQQMGYQGLDPEGITKAIRALAG